MQDDTMKDELAKVIHRETEMLLTKRGSSNLATAILAHLSERGLAIVPVETLRNAAEKFQEITQITAGCATSHGDAGGGLQMSNAVASEGWDMIAAYTAMTGDDHG